MGKSAPAPDYKAAAEQTGQSSKEVTNMQTWANRPDINTPFGSQDWTSSAQVDPATGQSVTKWTQNNNLDPVTAKALQSQQLIQQGKSDLAASKLGSMNSEFAGEPDWNSFTALKQSPDVPNYTGSAAAPTGNTQINGGQYYNQKAGDAVYNQFKSRMDPQFANENDALRTKLYNQGLKEGDSAYDKAMNSQSLQQNDARQTAMNQATTMAGAEGQRMQGMDTSAGNFWNQEQNQNFQNANTANQFNNANSALAFGQGQSAATMSNTQRQQQIAELMQKRGFSLNEMNAILNGQQVGMPQMPSFNQATKSDTVDYMGAAKAQYSAAKDAADSTNAMIGQAAGAASMFSDRRLKSNIRKIGKYHGHNLYVYDLFGRTAVGVMSDEVRHIPGVVSRHSSGFDMVNYDRL